MQTKCCRMAHWHWPHLLSCSLYTGSDEQVGTAALNNLLYKRGKAVPGGAQERERAEQRRWGKQGFSKTLKFVFTDDWVLCGSNVKEHPTLFLLSSSMPYCLFIAHDPFFLHLFMPYILLISHLSSSLETLVSVWTRLVLRWLCGL